MAFKIFFSTQSKLAKQAKIYTKHNFEKNHVLPPKFDGQIYFGNDLSFQIVKKNGKPEIKFW